MRPPAYYPPAPDPEVVEEMIEAQEEAEGAFHTRRHYWRGTVWLLVALGVQFLASLVPDVVDRIYSQGVYHYLSRLLTIPSKALQGVVLGELSFLLLISYFVVWTIWYIFRSWNKQARLVHVIKLFFLHVLWVFSILGPIFLFFWGLNYQRMPMAEKLGLERRPAARSGELDTIGIQLIDGVNKNYDLARAGQDWIGASKLPIGIAKLYQTLENSFQAEKLLGVASQGGFSDPKPLQLSRLTSLMGVSGFYIAYTTEVTYNSEVPDVDLPMVIAHHKAHQRGFAREDEANFIAFLICTKSTDPYVRYSGYMHGLRVLEPLAKGDPARYQFLYQRISAGAKDDMRVRYEFWGTSKNSYLGPLSRRLFDMYLRANRVESGVNNYDEDIQLMTSYFLRGVNAPQPVDTPTIDTTTPTPKPDLLEPEP